MCFCLNYCRLIANFLWLNAFIIVLILRLNSSWATQVLIYWNNIFTYIVIQENNFLLEVTSDDVICDKDSCSVACPYWSFHVDMQITLRKTCADTDLWFQRHLSPSLSPSHTLEFYEEQWPHFLCYDSAFTLISTPSCFRVLCMFFFFFLCANMKF